MTANNKNIGKIISFNDGVGKIQGLKSVFVHETLLNEEKKIIGFVIGFNDELVEALFFKEKININQVVYSSGETIMINVNDNIIGRTINPLGTTLDEYGPLKGKKIQLFQDAPQIIDRDPVTDPLITGIKLVDALLPIGRGQRELIIGDRKTGKSTMATDIVLNQKYATKKIHCIYALIGQSLKKFKNLVTLFNKNNTFLYSTIVAAPANSSYAEKYLAPFVACAIGEYFRDKGEDSLVIYDDITMHAKTYRDINLLINKTPGREAYPGDIFSLHAQLLERAAKLKAEKGAGSLTAIPIVETLEGDISSFISTNIISITDGQIYFDKAIYQKGSLPAVNLGLSVSRLGSKVQLKALEQVTSGLRLTLSQHKELQKLNKLETFQAKQAQNKITRGELLLELLKQEKSRFISWQEQVILFYIVENGLFDDLHIKKWPIFEDFFLKLISYEYPNLLKSVNQNGLGEEVKSMISLAVTNFKQEFI